MVDIYRIKAELAILRIIAIHAVFAIHHDTAVVTVLIVIRGKKKVAIFVFVGMGTVIGIFRADVNVVQARSFKPKFLKFFQEVHRVILSYKTFHLTNSINQA